MKISDIKISTFKTYADRWDTGHARPIPKAPLMQTVLAIETDEGLLSLNEALQRLARATPRLAEIVECRFFAGYGEEDTAAALGISLRTVQRDWLKARAWLFRELSRAV